jgi:ABC-type nitrate/sulfonate/bicarbonate transport system permease component
VVFAIIGFHDVEFRIFFIMVMATLPAFTFQVLGALRAMSRDSMVFSFRPTRMKLFRVMIAPAILPDILTGWKVNLGNASRVVMVAELVGAAGVGGFNCCSNSNCSTWWARVAYDVSFDAGTGAEERELIRSRIGDVLAA